MTAGGHPLVLREGMIRDEHALEARAFRRARNFGDPVSAHELETLLDVIGRELEVVLHDISSRRCSRSQVAAVTPRVRSSCFRTRIDASVRGRSSTTST